jgi:hypothetical protein
MTNDTGLSGYSAWAGATMAAKATQAAARPAETNFFMMLSLHEPVQIIGSLLSPMVQINVAICNAFCQLFCEPAQL